MKYARLGAILTILRAAPLGAQTAEALIKASDCSGCHATDRELVGPAYSSMAKRYAGQADAVDKLAATIRDGGASMPPHPKLADAQRAEIARWILTTGSSAEPSKSEFPHKLKDGSTVNLEFNLYAGGQPPKVTKEVFHGYQLFNSYCYRCHGTDASGGQLAPDLRRSLSSGMGRPGFAAAVVTGKADKGMPAWDGFLSGDDIVHIYQYVKGRSLDLVPPGRPPSLQD